MGKVILKTLDPYVIAVPLYSSFQRWYHLKHSFIRYEYISYLDVNRIIEKAPDFTFYLFRL